MCGCVRMEIKRYLFRVFVYTIFQLSCVFAYLSVAAIIFYIIARVDLVSSVVVIFVFFLLIKHLYGLKNVVFVINHFVT